MEKPGPTGEYPDGKLNDDDEGQLTFLVGNHLGRVILEFGKKVSWLGMEPQDARKVARALEHNADQAEGKDVKG